MNLKIEYMSKKKPRGNYTPQEEDVIYENISKYPGNLTLAFHQAALELGNRTAGAVSGHYYGKLKNNLQRPAYAIATTKGTMVNVKQVKRPENMNKKGLSAVDVALMAVDQLTQDEMKAVLRYMMRQQ